MVADVKHALILCAELFRSPWTGLCIIHLLLTPSFLFLFLIFFKVDFLMDYFLNHRSAGQITLHCFSAFTNKKKQ